MRIFVSAAESSGDAHAARLIRALRERRPDVELEGYGGDQMRAAGCVVHADLIAMASMFLGFLGHAHRYVKVLRHFDARLRKDPPDAVVLIDSPGFHFLLARLARWRGVPVVYYVCPQIWAWAPWRRAKVLRYTDLLLTILPFEAKLYENKHVPVRYVGHPLGDALVERPTPSVTELRAELGIGANEEVIGLFPGSREHEVGDLMPLFRLVLDALPAPAKPRHVVVSRFRQCFAEPIGAAMDGYAHKWTVFDRASHELAGACDLVLVASGTATLEVVFHSVPMVVLYRVGKLNHWLSRWVITSPFFSLPNILGAGLFNGEAIVHEELCTSGDMAHLGAIAGGLLYDEEARARMTERLRAVKRELFSPGASAQAAEEVLAFLANG